MSDPVRLRDAGDAFEMGLLASARDDVASAAVHENVHEALGLGVTVATAAAVTIASTSTAAGATKGATTLATFAGAKWLGVVVAAGVAVGGASVYVRASRPPTIATDMASVTATPTVPLTPTRNASAIPDPTAALPVPVSPRLALPPHPVPHASPAPPPVTPPASASLVAELAPIDAARAAFDSGDTTLALDQINRHDLDFPHGQLAPEALALRVEIYASRHDDAKVRELTTRFLASYPTHPDAARMRALADRAGYIESVPK